MCLWEGLIVKLEENKSVADWMIYVVAEEMIPEMTSEGHDHYGVWSFIIGFVIMLALDCIQF